MDRSVVHIVASCTDRKRLPIPDGLRLRTVRAEHRGDLFTCWWKALERHDSKTLQAVDLYAGDHWTVVRDFARVAHTAGLNARLWVASAGYGLVPSEAHLHAYGATFTAGHPDSIEEDGTGEEAGKEWWRKLTRRAGPVPSTPRSLAELARRTPDANMLVVASPRYIVAMEEDLLGASTTLRDPANLLIVSGQPGPWHETLRASWIPSVASLQAAVGGSRLSLHARVARRILEESARRGISAPVVRKHFLELARVAPPLPQYDRTPLHDDDVRRFITKELRKTPGVTHTRLLRTLRSSGRACEQGRFKRLFEQVKEQ